VSWGQTVGGGVIQRWWWPRMTLRLEGGCVVGQTVGGGVIHRWWWPKMTLRLAFQAREGVVESNSGWWSQTAMPLRLAFRAREEVVGQTAGGVAKNDPPSHVSSEGGCGGCAGWCWWAQIPLRFE